MAPFVLISVEQIGTRQGPAFVTRESGCSLENVMIPVYPPSPRGERLFSRRIHRTEHTLREAARLFGLTAVELSGLEHGWYTLGSDAEWDRMEAALVAATEE